MERRYFGGRHYELEKIDASETYPRRINSKEVLTPHKEDTFTFPTADGTAKLLGRDNDFRESALRQEQPEVSEDLSGELQGEPEGFQPTESRDDAEARKDFWSIQGDFLHRHHNEPRVQLYVPKGETFPIPLKYSDVTRSTHTNLDGKDDYWNVDANRSLSESWTGFTKFTSLKKKPPKGYMWSGRGLTKIKATTRLENVCPEVWTKIGKAAQKREKQGWATEKPKLDSIRRLRGIYFIDPDGGECKETINTCDEKIGSSDGGGYALQKKGQSQKKELIEPASGNCKAWA